MNCLPRHCIQLFSSSLILAVLSCGSGIVSAAADRPNVLWIFAEDTSPWMGCYGYEVNDGHTPNIDSLAHRGVRFAHAFVPAPVCSACRSALIVGQNQIRFGAHEHRSSRGPVDIPLPNGVKLLPQLMKESGYFTFNLGKTDYNFVWDQDATYSLMQRRRTPIPWDKITNAQPFFGQIQTAGGKNNTSKFPENRKTDPQAVSVPPDYPQTDLYREIVAEHFDSIRMDDNFIGEILSGLEEHGLSDNTIVVYFSDHGANHLVRHKQMPTEGGLHVPFIIAGPREYVPGQQVRDDLIDMLDLSATTLAWAGIEIPEWYEGQDLFGEIVRPRIYVAAAKDRLDHTIDRVRTVRTDRYRYTRNYKTDRIFLQPQYRDPKDYVKVLRRDYAEGTLPPKLAEIYFGERPAEELYDVHRDPHQLNNLAENPKYAATLAKHRRYLDEWLVKGDLGKREEPKAELAFQASGHRWGEGVNPEYEVVRQDNDGDGLSDDWERSNNRDPADGRIVYRFDCGGWQTEGWSGEKDLGNIAGRLGFLDFRMPGTSAVITRDGLSLEASKNTGQLVLGLRASAPLDVTLRATRDDQRSKTIGGPMSLSKTKTFQEMAFPLNSDPFWSGRITSLEFRFKGQAGSLVEIDSVIVK